MKTKEHVVFIVYPHKDREFAHKLAADIEEAAFEVLYDERIPQGNSWATMLSQTIETASFVLILLSPDFRYSPWAVKEAQIALLREADRQTLVVPLMVRQCEVPIFLARKNTLDCTGRYEESIQNLLGVLRESRKHTHPPPDPRSPPATENVLISPPNHKNLRDDVQAFKAEAPIPSTHAATSSESDDACKTCFVVMPFEGPGLQTMFKEFVKPAVIGCGLACQRGDEMFGSNIVMDDILSSIKSADIIVADLTGRNPNVLYEVGIAHAMGKKVLLMAQSLDDIPFDLRHRRVLVYADSLSGSIGLERKLRDHIKAL